MTRNGFGLRERKSLFEDYLGEYVIIFPANGTRVFGGKMVEIKKDSDYAVLIPFQGVDYTKKGAVNKLIDKRALVFLPGVSIEPTTKRNLENYCKTENQRASDKKEKLKPKPEVDR
ncbi:MAG TPA: hypothetical protein VJ438_00515 [Candidatus Nanoarchaeia archaeon]|nr:hypothetical protein [Candidatus Nanoarchaeia archaeon]